MAFAMVSLMQSGGRARSGWVLAGLLLLPALVLNPWTAERLFSPDGEIGSPTRMALLAWDGLFIGAALLVARLRPAVDLRIVALAGGSLLFSLGLVECSLEGMLRAPAAFARGPLFGVALDLYQRERRVIQFVEACAEYHPDLSYLLRPGGCDFENREFRNRFDVNRLGLRDDEASLEAPELIVLGDSHAMGWGVEQRAAFPELVERGSGRRTLNAAISSFGTARSLLNLERLDTRSLRVLVVQYCENDFEENGEFLSAGGRLDIMSAQEFEDATRQHARSTAYFPGRHFLRLADLRIVSPFLSALSGATDPLVPAQEDSDREEAARFLAVLRHLELGSSVDRVIVLELNPRRVLDSRFTDALVALLEAGSFEPGIRVVDVAPHLRREHFHLLDDHMNEAGHEVVARLLLDEIRLQEPGSASDVEAAD